MEPFHKVLVFNACIIAYFYWLNPELTKIIIHALFGLVVLTMYTIPVTSNRTLNNFKHFLLLIFIYQSI